MTEEYLGEKNQVCNEFDEKLPNFSKKNLETKRLIVLSIKCTDKENKTEDLKMDN